MHGLKVQILSELVGHGVFALAQVVRFWRKRHICGEIALAGPVVERDKAESSFEKERWRRGPRKKKRRCRNGLLVTK